MKQGWTLALSVFTLVAVLSMDARPEGTGQLPVVPGTRGAIRIPVRMPLDGKASIALYTKGGQLVRILGQMLEMKKGEYVAQWDGMDLWGNLLPAGTELVCKSFAGKGLRAFYEFTAGEGDRSGGPPWLTRPVGEGMAMRTGGWLADHTGPGAAAAIGDKVFLGSRVAEHGHSLIAVDLDGYKLWGGGLAGWNGPSSLFAHQDSVFALLGNAVWRIDPDTYERKQLFDTGRDTLLNVAFHGGKAYLTLKSQESAQSPFRYSVRSENIDFAASTPQMLGKTAPDWQISPREQFATVFNRGGHFQTGVRANVEKTGDGIITAVFQQPTRIGTLAMAAPGPDVARVEFWALRPGARLKPQPEAGPAKNTSPEDMDPAEDEENALDVKGPGLGEEWVLVGKTGFPHKVTYVTAQQDDFETRALTLRFVPEKRSLEGWKTGTAYCRILHERVERLSVRAKLILPADAKVQTRKDADQPQDRADGIAWQFRSAKPASEISPTDVIVDLGQEQSFDGLSFLNIVNPMFTVSTLKGTGDPAKASDGDWEHVADYKAEYSKKYGWSTASTHSNERYVVFPERIAARALRLRFIAGHLSGKNALARTEDDPHRFECEDMAFLRLLNERPKLSEQLRFVWQVRDAKTGGIVSSTKAKDLEVPLMAFAEDGTLFTVKDARLCRTEVRDGQMHHTVVNDSDLKDPRCMTVHGDQIVVGDRGRRAVLFFGQDGKRRRAVGDKSGPERGPWVRDRLDRLDAIAVDKNGKMWVAEAGYAPKRVARFSLDGQCEKEFLGPPEYGGGGYLDPDLKSFYYRGMEFEIDWEKGMSRLKNLNDRCYTEETPALEASTFAYTRIGCPITLYGRKYIVGSGVVCLMDGPVWKPCAVMGPANGSVFLLRKKWQDHWKQMDLTDKAFVWCDHNGDGQYQVEEVSLFSAKEFGGFPFDWGYWGTRPGPDLTFWSSAWRISPIRFTDTGVPIYDRSSFRRLNYDKSIYHKNLTVGMRAKLDFGGFRWVAHDGSVIVEGQPYVLRPDGTYRGGELDTKPSDYVPPINGNVIQFPLSYVGGAVTDSPVGEVVMLNGNNGVWSVVSVQDRVLLDQVFTGRDGDWSTDLAEKRGMDVTGRRHDSETFFGHFIRAQNRNYYTVAGKGFHGICRIEGLNDYQVESVPVTVTAESLAANKTLRHFLVEERAAWEGATKKRLAGREREIHDLSRRLADRAFSLDGDLQEWGGKKALQAIDEPWSPDDPPPQLFFDAAYDAKGLYLAYRGFNRFGNACDDPIFVFKTGFCFDFQYRSVPDRNANVVEGDRRIVFGKLKGRWAAVMYDYIDESVEKGDYVRFASPVVTTLVARAYVIPEARAAVKVIEENLEVMDEEAERPDQTGRGSSVFSVPSVAPERPGYSGWSAEVFLPWETLGMKKPEELRCDVGVLNADSGGIKVENRVYWASPGPHAVSDLGLEAAVTPGKWGVLKLK